MSDYKKLKILFKSLNECTTIESMEAILGDFFQKKIAIKEFNSIKKDIDISEYNKLYDKGTIIQDDTLKIALIIKGQLVGTIELAAYDNAPKVKELLELITPIISIKLDNITLSGRVQKNIEFHNAMKNIAKIIESQYELHYIIPVIGEILDTVISNHLVYLFLKDKNNENKLIYPHACHDKTILKTVNQITTDYKISEDKKTGYFPLISENNTIGCLVTKSTDEELSKQELYYIQQLTKQTATTITRANVYADILKHATLDALTGFYNRRQLDERIKQETASAKRKKTPLCAIMIDIDYFKKVNDTYGHAAGDLILKTVAKIMRSQLREYDIAGRYGGEEFVILLPQTNIEEALTVAERLRKSVEKKVIDIEKVNTKNKTKTISVTISLGVYSFNLTDKPEILIMNADKALYQAKESGRNRVVEFMPSYEKK